jgi:hypothetical protein
MSEIEAIVGIYGAVDGAVQGAAEARARVSKLLPLYRDPDLRWYDEFETWRKRTLGRAVDSDPLFPGLQKALSELALIEPQCRMRARRLFAIALAMRALPEMRDPDSELWDLAVRALAVDSHVETETHADSLCKLLANEPLLEGAGRTGAQGPSAWWDRLVTQAHDEGLISSVAGLRPRPCSGRLVHVPGIAGPVAALEAEFETDEVSFEAATKFIEPVHWPKCMPYFWCEMKPKGGGSGLVPGPHLYHEVVSTDCADQVDAAFCAQTELEFNFIWLPDNGDPEAAVANYQLANGRPHPHDVIRVDEGTLIVAQIPRELQRLRITTTKRIQFSYPFSSQALALIACALGYADAAADLLCCAATNGAEAGTDFPGESPPVPAPGARPSPARLTPSGLCVENPMCETVHEMAGVWADVLREGAAAVARGARESQGRARPPEQGRREG